MVEGTWCRILPTASATMVVHACLYASKRVASCYNKNIILLRMHFPLTGGMHIPYRPTSGLIAVTLT
eukprot:m.1438255 g.1438255  ORF g.1438255 m.1438255 type:complete len:67 (+) comp25089_c0_seq3:6768-6968(+)